MIEIDGLTKRYGDKTAVDGLSFVVEPGVVTGFLGPNGAGKPVTGSRHSLPPPVPRHRPLSAPLQSCRPSW
jgi:ABC-type glutathione transport system ATPase component